MMRRSCALVAVSVLVASPAWSATASLKQATQMLDRHYYESAAAMLQGGAIGGDPASVSFLLGRAYLGNAELHRALSRAALSTGTRYLKKVAGQGGRDRSRVAGLFYAEHLIESGHRKAGLAELQRFANRPGIPPVLARIARVRLAAGGGAAPAAASLDPESRTEFAAMLSLKSGRQSEAVSVLDDALAEFRKKGGALPMRAVTNAIGVYARAEKFDKALALIRAEDLGRPSFQETLGKSKTLRFYDAALLGNLALLYQSVGERTMNGLRNDARLKAIVNFFLAESLLSADKIDRAGDVLAGLAPDSLPVTYRNRAAILQAAVAIRKTRTGAGKDSLDQLVARFEQDPALVGETLIYCARFRVRCSRTTAAAQALAAAGQGERYRAVHRAIGELHAAGGHADRALPFLETARDKSNKNRIDTNDPLLLVQLADLYLATKSFSENLEIYFELSKEFPAVRQLQESGQGIYSTEYRSAGDVKIF